MIPAERLAQAQLDAYNAHDIDAFLAYYHEDVEIFDLHATVVQRIACGTTTVDHERVVGLVPNETVEVIATYQIVDDRIRRVWFAR